MTRGLKSWAAENGIDVDTFCVYTDNETWAGKVHPAQALRAYRQARGIPAKLVVVGMTSTGFSIADPNDAGMIDVVGFDASTPPVIADFARASCARRQSGRWVAERSRGLGRDSCRCGSRGPYRYGDRSSAG